MAQDNQWEICKLSKYDWVFLEETYDFRNTQEYSVQQSFSTAVITSASKFRQRLCCVWFQYVVLLGEGEHSLKWLAKRKGVETIY